MKKLFSAVMFLLIVSSSLMFHPGSFAQEADPLETRLRGLEFEQFLDESFTELLRREPELVMQLGLSEVIGLDEVGLTNVSEVYIQETYAIHALILDLLHEYDRAALTPDQQLSFDIYEWYLDDVLRGQEFQYYTYPVTYYLSSVQNLTSYFFLEIHPLLTVKDAQDYVTRLWLVDDKFEQVIERMEIQQEAGIVPPRFVLEWTIGSMQGLTDGSAARNPYLVNFREKLNSIELSDTEKEALLEEASRAVEEAVIPAYAALSNALEALIPSASQEVGVGQFPRGDEYYAYQLHHHTTTDMSAEEIHALGLHELERIQAEMRAVFDELGYPPDESLYNLYQRVARDGGLVRANEAITTYDAIIAEASERLPEAFDIFPNVEVIVRSDPGGGGYYTPAALDGSRPGIFYAWTGGTLPLFDMYSLAYHETVPGHHLQIALAQAMNLPSFRQNLFFNAYTEGWALYAEQLAAELNWYQDNPYGYLGYLRYQAFRAARLVVDTGIHAMGWTFDEAVDFWVENVGHDENFASGQIARYIVDPGQATSYMVGMLVILDLRQQAQTALGDQFDLIEFHRVILSRGSMPLDTLEQVVAQYLAQKLQ